MNKISVLAIIILLFAGSHVGHAMYLMHLVMYHLSQALMLTAGGAAVLMYSTTAKGKKLDKRIKVKDITRQAKQVAAAVRSAHNAIELSKDNVVILKATSKRKQARH